VVDWLGVVVVLWLGVTVVPVAFGVVWVADGAVCVAEGVVWVADGVPTEPAPPGAVVVELVPVCVPVVPAVPVALPVAPLPPVVCAAARAIATASASKTSKVLGMIAPWPGRMGHSSLSGGVFSPVGCGAYPGRMAPYWPSRTVTVQ
jgi:hypothetical protein